tara:strand:- start:331 stop:2265 length:1935 start_codon:yes stop_codon:yes gene_type:complete
VKALRYFFLLHLSFLFMACGSETDSEPASNDQAMVNPEEVSDNIPSYPIEDFMNSISYGGASFSPDNSKILVHNNSTGIFNVYAIPTDGSPATQLTNSTSNATLAVSYFAEDERFLYTADQGGNELNHLYLMELDGEEIDLTPGDNLKAAFAGWAADYQSFYVQSNERDPRFFDVYRYQVADSYPRELIYLNEDGFSPAGISDNGRFLALAALNTADDNDLYIEELATGERTDITPHEGNVSSSPADFSPDSKYLYYTTDENSEFQHLMRYELATGEKEEVLSMDWDIAFASFSRAGKYLVTGTNVDARTEISIFDAETLEPITPPSIDGANIASVRFSHGDSDIAMYGSGSRFPSDLFIHSVGRNSPPTRLTRSLHENIDPEHLARAEVVRFPSYDDLQIPGILYVPPQASEDNKLPALVWVHGGPGGQSRAGYNGLIQYLVNQGHVVYAINNRGSSGYGKTFYAMDNKRHGEADLGDVVASKQMLIDTGLVDPERIGIIGGSYGGYMVVAALAFAPEEFNVGVDIFGVTNWLRTLESIPPWWEAQKTALYDEMGDPATDRDRLERISPLFHASNIVKPMIVLQGANDPRVLQVESDEMVAAVRRNDVHVDYHVYPDEGHGFRNRDNQIQGYKAIAEFLDRYL